MKTLRLNSNDRSVLLGSGFFEKLPMAATNAILDDVVVSTHEEHDILFGYGEPLDHVFFVLSGLVRLYRLGKDGREADIAVFPRGELFGESAMFLGNRATVNAQAIETTMLARIDSRKLRKLAEQTPEIADALMQLLCRHAQMAEIAWRKTGCSRRRSGLPATSSETAPMGLRTSPSACPSRRMYWPENWAWRRKHSRAPSRHSAAQASRSRVASSRSMTGRH